MLSRPLALKISSAADLVLLAIFAIESPRATMYSVLSGPCAGEKNAWMFRSPSSCLASRALDRVRKALDQSQKDPFRIEPIASPELLFRLIEHRDTLVGRWRYDCLTQISPAGIIYLKNSRYATNPPPPKMPSASPAMTRSFTRLFIGGPRR